MRLATPLALITLAAGLLCGCGSSGDNSTMTGPHISGGTAKPKMRAFWMASPSCKHPQGASRWGCSVGPYRCQAVVVDRGWSVNCAKPGRSISFTIPARK